MPELPEVETVVRGLTKHIIGQTIKDVVVSHKKSFQGSPSTSSGNKKLRGLKIKEISRRGKGIIINFAKQPAEARSADRSPSELSLLIHLKMTGQLIYISGSPIKSGMTENTKRSLDKLRMTQNGRHAESSSASKNKTLKRVQGDGNLVQDDKRLNFGHPTDDFTNTMPSKHTRVIFKLSKGTLYFNDQRIFGWVKILPTEMIKNDKFISKLGPDALKISTPHMGCWIKRRPKSPIKAILLDQSVLTGLGNIYADEVLFEAKICPTRKGLSITNKDIENLVKAIKKILKLGIKHSGTSIINYKTPEGSMGKMQNYLKVYMQDKQPCKVCKTPISKIRVANRGTHFCPKCQK